MCGQGYLKRSGSLDVSVVVEEKESVGFKVGKLTDDIGMVSGGIVSGCSMRTHSAASKYE
jgi:hypothetical protein